MLDDLKTIVHLFKLNTVYMKLDISTQLPCIVAANFGPWQLGPQHGFARISPWLVEKPPTKV